ncbi:MAG: glycoprotease, metallo-protease family [Burkholderiales bacterium]|jgi:tRNA threonylcarbamoyladenosine biosynthesis protein TsaB|nr:glycoprotease, metallo-protease family [Burkholderiales bacterium]
MRFAAIETSTQWCSVALWSDGEVASLERFAGQRHSELVLPMLESLFKDRKIEIDAVAFGAGPGSFTGLRIACALAQGLALPRALPVLGVSTLEALAEESGARRVAACIDARMREVYYAALERQGAHWRETIPAQCLPPDAVPRPVGDGWVGCGSGFDAYGDLGFARILAQVHPTAAAVAALAAPRLAAGEGVDAALAAPVYLRDKVALTKEEQAAR